MYEHMTYDFILERMLERVPSDVDKREGSIIYDAIAPAAVELTQMYIELDSISTRISVDTATGSELTELSYQNGVFRKQETRAIRKGVFNIEIPINSRFSNDTNTYIVLEKIKDFEYKLECEQAGETGNLYTGTIIPIDYIEGLTTAILTDIIVLGVGEEADDQLRERYRQSLIDSEQNGNVAQYKEWAESYNGIGISKVFPLWNGGNTVKVAVTNRLFQVADSTLVHEFQNYLDPNSEGLGNGVSPIGAKVTVTGGNKKVINIAGNIVLAEGFTEPEGVAESISNYLASITFVKNRLSYMRMAVTILDTPSIADLNNLTINGSNIDVDLIGEDIPILGGINLTVVSG